MKADDPDIRWVEEPQLGLAVEPAHGTAVKGQLAPASAGGNQLAGAGLLPETVCTV